ncbi:MAG TPA: class I SAM-dependent methyltransferase [Candidatus Competibacteraceae bacterium]|nr:class I SAM-dependent methyltransferase [Candidatus Competibacteraceae bacterium]
MNLPFNDHFAPVAPHYARFRPTYPEALFAWLATATPGRERAWDCAAGNGQATLDLARYFRYVIATDASRTQIDAAPPHPNVEYRVAPAEASGLADASVDLITVAQALHWFDLDRFYGETRRVLKPGGILAAWTYGVLVIEDARVNTCVLTFYRETAGPCWPSERRHVESGYRTLPFPFREIPAPAFCMTAAWTLPELLGYIRSWSATGRYLTEHGVDPVNELAMELAPLWGSPATRRQVNWPLSLRVGQDRA